MGVPNTHPLTTPTESWVVQYSDVILSTMVSQIASLANAYSTVYSGTDKKFKALRHWPSCVEFTGDQRIPRTKGQ